MTDKKHDECCHHQHPKKNDCAEYKDCTHTPSIQHILNCLKELREQTQWAHWTVGGPHFASWHALYGTHYEQLTAFLDEFVEHLIMRHHLNVVYLCSQTEHRELKQNDHKHSVEQMHTLKMHAEKIQNQIRILLKDLECPSLVDILTEGLRLLEKQDWFYDSSLRSS